MSEEQVEVELIEGILRAGSFDGGGLIFIDVKTFDHNSPSLRLQFQPELLPQIIGALAQAGEYGDVERNKGKSPGAMRSTSALEVTGFSIGEAFDPSFIPLRLNTHTGAKIPFVLPIDGAAQLCQRLQEGIERARKKKPATPN